MAQFGIGQPAPRIQDPRLLTGRGNYTDDLRFDNETHGYVLRSPHAHARIKAITVDAAVAIKGVLGIYTGEDIKKAGLGTIPCMIPLVQSNGEHLVTPPWALLADGIVRHVGDPVAFIVAESHHIARDAAEAIMVDYEPLPAVTDTATAAEPTAPQVWPDAPNNTSFVWESGDKAATDAAFAKAAEIVELDLINNRVVVNALEPRAAIGDWDGQRSTLYTPSQGPHGLQRQLVRNIFNVPFESMRVVTGDVGGGFGMKIFLYPEQALVLHAARDLGRPVRWVAERSSDGFVSDTQGRDNVSHGALALDQDGNFLGLRVRTHANLGAYLSNFSPYIVTACGTGMLAGVYKTAAIHVEVHGVFTNTVPVDAYRGAGRPEAIYVIERLVDHAARTLGVSPADLRRQNFIPPELMPYKTAMNNTYDSGQFTRNLNDAQQTAERMGFEKRRASAAKHGKLRGLGISYYVESCGKGPGEFATIRAEEDGAVAVLLGNQSNGQGHETAYAQIVSERLGIDIEKIRFFQGDTDIIPRGGGTGGSRAIPEGGHACINAADAMIAKGKRVAASVLEAAETDIDYANGAFSIAGTDRKITLADTAIAAKNADHLGPDDEPGLSAMDKYVGSADTFPNGCHIAEIEIDKETGRIAIIAYTAVDDFGTVLNPSLLAGQVHGGIAQGIGQALLEACLYDPENGQLLSGSLMDYCLPRADDLPSIDLTIMEDVPCTTNDL
ncbi:MAG: xanthine dehydrogenase family protein molybdopterin-binding subunit, partial [Proteobacteria bacterium]|nr:xanthine dehydrogenase family protein molybdopterin-binding subunit [Pseudomonadota bacterium]